MPKRNLDLQGKRLELTKECYDALWDFNPNTVIVGIDPGVTTGVSVIAYKDLPESPSEIPFWGSTQVSYGGSGNDSDVLKSPNPEIEVAKRIGNLVQDLSEIGDVRIILAVEDFIVRQMNQSRDFLAPVRITAGLLQAASFVADHNLFNIDYVMQSPADAKSICKDERMDLWGYRVETLRDRHSRDADRHAVLCLRKLMEKPRSFSSLQT